MTNIEKKKLIEFVIYDGKIDRHFEITGTVTVVHNKAGYPFIEADELNVYEFNKEEKVDYFTESDKWNRRLITWTGRELSAADVLDDVLERYVRNQMDGFKVLYIDPVIESVAIFYHNRTALRYMGRDIPYQIIDNDDQRVYRLLMATSKYLYYTYEDMFLMLYIHSGELISDNYFAETGYWDSEEAIENGDEEQLVFKKYMHPKKPYETALKFDLWRLM